MPYSYRLKDSARRFFERLDRNLQSRIVAKIRALQNNPRPPGSIKLAGGSGLHRIRVGNYRIVYSVNDPLLNIEVTIIAHRREVYRDL